MLKRYQVIINDWLADALKETAKEHNLSFSEVLRLSACIHVGEMINQLHPEYKFPFNTSKMKDLMIKHADGKIATADMQKTLSQIYYETRKAVEFSSNKKQSKKKAS